MHFAAADNKRLAIQKKFTIADRERVGGSVAAESGENRRNCNNAAKDKFLHVCPLFHFIICFVS